jgi:serine/threonine-protein kinase
MPEVGETLAGKYRLEGALGEGGMGVVFRAEHLKLARKVAIKMLLPDALGNAEMITRLQREARAAGQLESPHVAHILDVDETPDGVPYIVMELLEGHDLDQELAVRGRLPLPEAVEWVLQACDAMIEAHARGIVHRDLKPSNLFLATGRGGKRMLKILDFGISKLQSEANVKLTLTNASMGTPLYMSPEQVRSADVAGPASDQWALGVILYELLTGASPFTGSTVAAVAASVAMDEPPPLARHVPNVPDAVQAAVRRALTKDPGGRFPDVAAFAGAIAPFAPPSVSLPPRSSLPVPASQTVRLRPSVPARTGPVVETSAGTTTSAEAARRRAQPRGWVMIGVGVVAVAAASAGIATWARRPASVTTTVTSSVASPVVAPALPAPATALAPATSAPAPSVAPVSSESPPAAPPRPRTSLPSVAPPARTSAAVPTVTATPTVAKPVAAPPAKTAPPVPDNPERL